MKRMILLKDVKFSENIFVESLKKELY